MASCTLSHLPPPLIGNILTYNSPRDAKALACTSKEMNELVNTPEVTQILIHTLTTKLLQPKDYCAAILDTKGARSYLWEVIQTNGDYETYQVIQQVYNLVTFCLLYAEAIKSPRFEFSFMDGRLHSPSPNTSVQLKSGFELEIDCSPTFLTTPLGRIRLMAGGASTPLAYFSISEWFIQRLGGLFQQIRGMQPYRTLPIEIITPKARPSVRLCAVSSTDVTTIPLERVSDYVGTPTQVHSPYCGEYSICSVTQVNGVKVPPALSYAEGEPKRKTKTLRKIWELLEQDREKYLPTAERNVEGLKSVFWCMRFLKIIGS